MSNYTGNLYKRYNKNKTNFKWYYKIKINNEIISNKSCKTTVKKDAKKILDTKLYELNNGVSSALTKDMSLNDYLQCWLEDNVKLNCKYNTYETYKLLIHEHVKNTIGIYSIKQIDTYLMQQFINNMHKKEYSQSTIELTKNMLSGAFKCAIQTYNLISFNPVKYTKIPRFESDKKAIKDKIITLEQYNKLLELSKDYPELHLCLQIGFHTGMRKGEVLGLQWENVDLKNKIIHVKYTLVTKTGGIHELGTPKTKSSIRDITIGDTLVKILKLHKKRQKENKLRYGENYIESDWVCTTEIGEIYCVGKLEPHIKKIKRKIDFDFTFHYLRHTHATLLIEAGANMKDVQKRLGHDNLATTMDIYSHVTNKMKNETVDIFESIIK